MLLIADKATSIEGEKHKNASRLKKVQVATILTTQIIEIVVLKHARKVLLWSTYLQKFI